jgi:RNA polymerase sigma-70 factor, ECF subfamily
VHLSDTQLIASARSGDGDAFGALVDRHSPALLGVALCHVANRAVAEEVVAETWMDVIRGLARFDTGSSFRSWIFHLLSEVAQLHPDDARPPARTPSAIVAAIRTLPPAQGAVVTLRDVEGWPARDACAALCLREADQRRLLHRARTGLKATLVTSSPAAGA